MSIAHPPVAVFLAVIGQVLLHIPPLVNLATLHFRLFTETTFYAGSQRFRSVAGGQKIPLERPRVRTREGREVKLESYGQLQQRRRTATSGAGTHG
jgi:hypothetical protein